MFLVKKIKKSNLYEISHSNNSCQNDSRNGPPYKGSNGSLISRPYEDKNCVGCIRSSPIASLVGLITIFFGIGAVGGGFVLSRKYMPENISEHIIFPFMDFIPYVVVGGVVVYALLSYVLASLSSGYNRKRFFEGSRITKTGKCCTIFNILCHILLIMIWIFVSCFTTFCLISSILVYCRSKRNKNSDLSYYGLNNITFEIPSNDRITDFIFSIAAVVAGSFIIILGHIQMLCCASMNYVRLCEQRYYDNNSDTNEKSDQVLSAF